MTHETVWHDVECASYVADLPLWRELAETHGAPVLDLGCGTGRVALHLAERGHEVVGIDADRELADELARRAADRDLPVETVVADARSFRLARHFPLIVAPMQVVQLLGGTAGRRAMLARVADHLEPGGVLAVALADPFDDEPPDDALLPLGDMLEREGWVLSSRPVSLRVADDSVVIDRLRQAVSPTGELSEDMASVRLDLFEPTKLEREAQDKGLRALPRRRVPATADHVSSTVVLLRSEV
jgi:SAM-dependent methyltransferase